MKKPDERQLNMLASIVLSVGILMVCLTFYNLVIVNFTEVDEFLHQCDVEGVTCTIDPSPLVMLFGLPAPLVFFVVLNWLEKKRIKNWRSYD
jgi:hypothetical protein|tara:strand:- start:392 stop:667 length:276 start_codon:yes stop_codon:yes gene_type:complete